MHSSKKINSDIFFLILLVVRLGFEPNNRINNILNQEPESRAVFLGPTSAYTQINFHRSFSSNRYPHLKSLGYNHVDEATILFSRLNFLNSLANDRERETETLIACIANSLDKKDEGGDEYLTHTHDCPNSEGGDNGFDDHPLETGTGLEGVNGGTVNERDGSMGLLETVELSPEEMDLIEILWKQDIDLGVSRNAYDSRQCLEVDKLKEVEIQKEKDLYDIQIDTEPSEEPTLVPNTLGLNYTIDSETGEYVIEEFCELNGAHHSDLGNEPLLKEEEEKFIESVLLGEEENETLGALSQDSYLPFDESEFGLTEVFSPNHLSQFFAADISNFGSDYLTQIEDLEKELGLEYETLNDSNGNSPTSGEMYPNIEEGDDCWPGDTTTMLPLLALSPNAHTHPTSLTPHSIMHSYSPLSSVTPYSSPLEVPTVEEFQPTSISPTIGPSSIGCAVVESMALTNDSGGDPLPSNSIMNVAYHSEFPEMIYSNHTVAVPHNELLISDLLLDDDLHLVSLPSNSNEEKLHVDVCERDHMETSSENSSGQLLSVSDYESERSFSDVHFDLANCSDQQYFAMKSYYSDISENCVGVKITNVDKNNFNKKYDYSSPKTSFGVISQRERECGSTNFLHHNHSYHLPISSFDDSRYKSVSKDKAKSHSSFEEIGNKDEKRARELKLPISINDIINLAIDEYNEKLSKFELSEAQLTLIRDIRRRGKNKVAAQNCRKRKMDQISTLKQDLNFLQREKMQVQSKQNHLLEEKRHFGDKYVQLYDLVLRNSNSKPPNPPSNSPVHRNDRMMRSTNSELLSEDDSDPNRGARTKRKLKK